ncbi:MAG: hypothetical protein E7600_09025 [Ruminococcaceae bacterium]|nr:hypothetical protein [Oscillospiraceae bacterium]
MKKFYYILGAVAAAAAIFAIIAVMLKKLRVSLCIEGLDEDILDDAGDHDDITLSFEDSEDCFDDPDIETIISED